MLVSNSTTNKKLWPPTPPGPGKSIETMDPWSSSPMLWGMSFGDSGSHSGVNVQTVDIGRSRHPRSSGEMYEGEGESLDNVKSLYPAETNMLSTPSRTRASYRNLQLQTAFCIRLLNSAVDRFSKGLEDGFALCESWITWSYNMQASRWTTATHTAPCWLHPFIERMEIGLDLMSKKFVAGS